MKSLFALLTRVLLATSVLGGVLVGLVVGAGSIELTRELVVQGLIAGGMISTGGLLLSAMLSDAGISSFSRCMAFVAAALMFAVEGYGVQLDNLIACLLCGLLAYLSGLLGASISHLFFKE